MNEGKYDGHDEWIVARNMAEYRMSFQQLAGDDTKISGAKARSELVRTYCSLQYLAVRTLCDLQSLAVRTLCNLQSPAVRTPCNLQSPAVRC